LKELNLLKQAIDEEFIKQAEFVDDIQEIFEINGYHQKGRKYGKFYY
jgi:hypothetical protein